MDKSFQPLDGIYSTIDSTFDKMGLPRMEDTSGSLVYRDNGHARDYGRFGKIVNHVLSRLVL